VYSGDHRRDSRRNTRRLWLRYRRPHDRGARGRAPGDAGHCGVPAGRSGKSACCSLPGQSRGTDLSGRARASHVSITAALSYHAPRTADRDALVFEEQRISWRHLNREINRLAGFIAAATPGGGGVALHLPTSPALALLFLAVARAGRVAQVLDPDWPAEM